jgi:hypothetical protein
MPRSKEVDAWFSKYQNPMKPVVERIRTIVLDSDPRMEECIKWQAPTFVYRGNLASFFPRSKQHASLMFHTGAQIPGKHPLLEGDGDTGRVVKIASIDDAESARGQIERVVRAWCDWRDKEAGTGPSRSKKPAAKKPAAKKPAAKSGGYDQTTAGRVRAALAGRRDVVEKHMFGGLTFMVNGQMCCGLTESSFMVRVGPDAYDEALLEAHARPMDFTGRPLKGLIYVDPPGYKTDAQLKKWIALGVAFTTSSKPKRQKPSKPSPAPRPRVRASAAQPTTGRSAGRSGRDSRRA